MSREVDTAESLSHGGWVTYREGDPQPVPYYPSVGDGEVEMFVRRFVTGS